MELGLGPSSLLKKKKLQLSDDTLNFSSRVFFHGLGFVLELTGQWSLDASEMPLPTISITNP